MKKRPLLAVAIIVNILAIPWYVLAIAAFAPLREDSQFFHWTAATLVAGVVVGCWFKSSRAGALTQLFTIASILMVLMWQGLDQVSVGSVGWQDLVALRWFALATALIGIMAALAMVGLRWSRGTK